MPYMSRRDLLRLASTYGFAGALVPNAIGSLSSVEGLVDDGVDWYPFPDTTGRIRVHGLAFFEKNEGQLWRLPRSAYADATISDSVKRLSKYPAGARLRFRSNTTKLHVEVTTSSDSKQLSNMSLLGSHGLNVYVNGQNWSIAAVPLTATGATPKRITFFETILAPVAERDYEIYLPLFRECMITRIGLSRGASLGAANRFAMDKTILVYGSSVAHGSGASRPAMTYEAVLARLVGGDFINFGFSGSGKGGKSDLDHITQSPRPRCVIVDVGMSFSIANSDHKERYKKMLDQFRKAYPDQATSIICVQPILGPAGFIQPNRVESQKLVAEGAAAGVAYRKELGDKNIFLIDGTELLDRSKDADGFHELVHPSDLGYTRIAERLHAKMKNWGIA